MVPRWKLGLRFTEVKSNIDLNSLNLYDCYWVFFWLFSQGRVQQPGKALFSLDIISRDSFFWLYLSHFKEDSFIIVLTAKVIHKVKFYFLEMYFFCVKFSPYGNSTIFSIGRKSSWALFIGRLMSHGFSEILWNFSLLPLHICTSIPRSKCSVLRGEGRKETGFILYYWLVVPSSDCNWYSKN